MGGPESCSGYGDKGNNPVPPKNWAPFLQPFLFSKMCGNVRICMHVHTHTHTHRYSFGSCQRQNLIISWITHWSQFVCYSDLPPISCCLATAVSMS